MANNTSLSNHSTGGANLCRSYGTVWTFGKNDGGQLGLGSRHDAKKKAYVPTLVSKKIKARQLDCGFSYTVVIDNENHLWMWGDNSDGQLGVNPDDDLFAPMRHKLPNVCRIGCGMTHTAAIDTENNIRVCGSNGSGQLGLGDEVDYSDKFTLVPELKARQVSCGYNHTAVVDSDGNVWMWGANDFGQLGLGDTDDSKATPTLVTGLRTRQVDCGANHTALIDMNGAVWICGGEYRYYDDSTSDVVRTFVKVPLPTKAQEVSCGNEYTMVVDSNNDVWVWGDSNITGQFGLGYANEVGANPHYVPVKVPNIQARRVSCGEQHTALIDLENNLWICGSGILGLGRQHKMATAFMRIPGFKVLDVSCGNEHTAFIAM